MAFEPNHENHKNTDIGPRLDEILLWDDHFYLTRQVVIAAVGESSCLGVDVEALNHNQERIGQNFARLTCNKKAGKQLTEKLLEHIEIAIQIVLSAIAGDLIRVIQQYELWIINAKEIAAIYAKYNHCIKYRIIEEMMLEHLETTFAEAVAIIFGDCEQSTERGNIALAHVREMAIYIASKFKKELCCNKPKKEDCCN